MPNKITKKQYVYIGLLILILFSIISVTLDETFTVKKAPINTAAETPKAAPNETSSIKEQPNAHQKIPPSAIESNNQPLKPAKIEKINDDLELARQQIRDRYFSEQEPTAKDALWTMHDIFKVAVVNDGHSRNGYAESVCLTLYDYGFKGEKVWVQIIDIEKVVNDKKFVKIGEAHCL